MGKEDKWLGCKGSKHLSVKSVGHSCTEIIFICNNGAVVIPQMFHGRTSFSSNCEPWHCLQWNIEAGCRLIRACSLKWKMSLFSWVSAVSEISPLHASVAGFGCSASDSVVRFKQVFTHCAAQAPSNERYECYSPPHLNWISRLSCSLQRGCCSYGFNWCAALIQNFPIALCG